MADPQAAPGVRLTDPVTLAGRDAPSRVVFGPHETNLGRRRGMSRRHAAYYRRRALGGAGVIITETASVHPSDWPYERAPLARDCREGWREIAGACHRPGALVLAGLGHTGLQGSSAYSQAALWGPSRFTDPISRETPMVMELPEISALIEGFAEAARTAVASGLDGVEIDAGPGALLRQFHSGLTNQRGDAYGTDRLALTIEVLAAVRAVLGREHVLGLRLSCDELAPWAGVTPEIAAGQAGVLAPHLDLLTVVRGGPYSASGYRPDGHTPPMFNLELARTIRAAVAGAVPVVLQGSMVDPAAAQAAIDDGAADLAEMTRAQVADAELVAKLRAGHAARIRPCILCNQACRVRDNRNPVISCVGDPRSGHETEDPPEDAPARDHPAGDRKAGGRLAGDRQAGDRRAGDRQAGDRQAGDRRAGDHRRREVLVVGGGPAGLEAARVAALGGHQVRLAERNGVLGGALRTAAIPPGRERLALLADWLAAECERLGVRLETGTEITAAGIGAAAAQGIHVILATGSRPAPRFEPGPHATPAAAGAHATTPAQSMAAADGIAPVEDSAPVQGIASPQDPVARGAAAAQHPAAPDPAAQGRAKAPGKRVSVDALAVLSGAALPEGPVVVHDPVGGPAGVAVAEWLAAQGRPVAVVTPDPVVGTLLALSGDLADANVRLQRAGVAREIRSLLRAADGATALLEDAWTGERRSIGCTLVIDCGHRLPDESLYAERPGTPRAGDCVAPRTIAEAVLEGRRRALELRAPEPGGIQE